MKLQEEKQANTTGEKMTVLYHPLLCEHLTTTQTFFDKSEVEQNQNSPQFHICNDLFDLCVWICFVCLFLFFITGLKTSYGVAADILQSLINL